MDCNFHILLKLLKNLNIFWLTVYKWKKKIDGVGKKSSSLKYFKKEILHNKYQGDLFMLLIN